MEQNQVNDSRFDTEAPSRLRVKWEAMLSEIREARNEFGKVVEEVESEVKVVKDEKTGMIESIKEIMSKGLEKESEETQGVKKSYKINRENGCAKRMSMARVA